MKCLHCGYCCIKLAVVIVKPSFVSENLDINELPREAFIFKETDVRCPHLSTTNRCTIHHFPWYKETPCFSHTQIESKDSDCRIGRAYADGKIKF